MKVQNQRMFKLHGWNLNKCFLQGINMY